MNDRNWQVFLGLSLLTLSAAIYYIQITIFDNVHDTFFYLLQDLAFVPAQILLVTLIINQFLSMREKRAMLKKMNMVIGVFFSEVGIELVKCCFSFDQHGDELKKELMVAVNWTEQDFQNAHKVVSQHDYKIKTRTGKLENLQEYLLSKRQFLLGLLANPNLLEHDSFTELLWAVFHLAEELAHRDEIIGLPSSDYEHMAGDIERVYSLLTYEWLSYISHLKSDYPYLFSLAIRTNPFIEKNSVIVQHSDH